MKHKPIQLRHFIFDLDGTLVDSTAGIQAAVESAWISIFPEKPIPDVQEFIGPPIRVILKNMHPTASFDQTEAFAKQFRQAYDEWGWQGTKLFDNVNPFLDMLLKNGCKCYCVTNKPSLPTYKILKSTGLETVFSMFISPDSATHPFNNKAGGIEHIIKNHHLIKEISVMIGDTIEDAQAAFDTGLNFIFRKGATTLSQGYPVLLEFSDFESIAVLIKPYVLPNN